MQISAQELSFRQRWNNYFVIIFSLIGLFIGLNLRDQILNATSSYSNAQVGIRAHYPRGWLIDSEGDYIFRVRDMSNLGFKTTIQVTIQAVSESATARNIIDILTLNRSQSLAVYDVLSVDDKFLMPDQTLSTSLNYTYVAIEPNPLLQSVPVVVKGLDVISIRSGQAIIISFIADEDSFLINYPTFQRFLDGVDF